MNSIKKSIPPFFWVGAVMLFLHGIGFLFPEPLWGIHYLAFLPVFLKISLPLLALLVLYPAISNWVLKLLEKSDRDLFALPYRLAATATLGLIFYSFPMAKDLYGESFNYGPYMNDVITELDPIIFENLFAFDLRPATGRKTLLALHSLASCLTQQPYAVIFKGFGVLAGMGFVFTWITGVKQHVQNHWWRLILTFAGLAAPSTLIFYGHTDTYALVYLALLLWVFGLLKQLKNPQPFRLWGLFVGLLICVKLHPLSVLLFPGWLLSALHFYFSGKQFVRWLLRPKGILIFVLSPLFLAGGLLYFFVFEDHRDPRILQDIVDFDRLFLPLFSPEAPLDRYNLLSFNHFIDFFNVMLMWSPIGWFILISVVFKFWKKLSLNNLELLIPGTTIVIFASFLFVINPLISMPMDWDLFCIPGFLFLVLTVSLIGQIEKFDSGKKLVPIGLSLVILSLSVFIVHASLNPLSYRLESTGKWVYKTYYEHSPKYIHSAIGMIEGDSDLYLERKQRVVEDLEPWSLPGNDVKYAMFHTDNGIMYDRLKNDLNLARQAFERADFYDPTYGINLDQLVNVCFRMGDYTAAHKYAQRMVQMEYPNRHIALSIALNCALEARLNQEALVYCEQLLLLNPEDQEILEIRNGLKAN